MNADFFAVAVDLAREPPFRLGGLFVRPSLRAIEDDCGQETIEPRVMQTMVALARCASRVVSRDELVAACWEGRSVGDDAINRCISKLRRIGDASGAFAIETIPRVGYRLLETTAAAPAEGRADDEVVLAVLPFENLSADPHFGYFADGVCEEILQALAQRAGLKVIGRSSSFQFRGPDKAIPNVVQQLGATHVLDGAVRRSGQQIRVSAQLIEGASQTTVWASQFEGELSDVFALQDAIAADVAHAMRRTFHPAVRQGAVDPVAYDLFLQGSMRPSRIGADSLRARLAQIEEVVRRAPEFAAAWGALGYVRAELAPFVPAAQAAGLREEARAAAQHALKLDPQCAQAAAAMARADPLHAALLSKDEWLGKALAWAPNDSAVARLHARLMATAGRMREALVLMRRAHGLDPLDPHSMALLGRTLFENGELAEAEAVLSRGLARWPDFELFPLWLAYTVGVQGDLPRVRALLDGHHLGANQREVAAFVDIYVARSPTSRERAVAALRRQAEQATGISLDILLLASELGALDEVFAVAQLATFRPALASDPRGTSALDPAILFMPRLGKMRQDPRFLDICAKLDLVDYWRATDKWPDCVDEVAHVYDFRAAAEAAAARRGAAPGR